MRKMSLFNLFVVASLAIVKEGRSEWPTAWSGTLPRPILFVHGIAANHETWQVDVAKKVCNPTAVDLVNYYSFQNAVTRSKPLGHLFEFKVSCDDGSSHKVIRKFNNSSSGNRMDNKLPATAAVNTGTPSAPHFEVQAVEWYLWTANNSKLNFYRLKSRPNSIDATVFRSIKTSEIAEVIRRSWSGRAYEEYSGGYENGLVRAYKEEFLSAPALLAKYYGMPADAIRYNYPANPTGSMINHNGMEFYSSVNPRTKEPDGFARPDKTAGEVFNSTQNKYEIGQTNQLLGRLSALLSEYYPTWATDLSKQIDIVCHSQGCLVARALFLTETGTGPDNPVNHIRSITMLTSPQLGTSIATDNSGVPAANKLRQDVYGLYTKGCLNKIPVTIDFGDFLSWVSFGALNTNLWQVEFKLDPLKPLRDVAANFIGTDQYLAYSRNIREDAWLPSTSVMRTGTGSGAGTGSSDFTTTIHLGGYPRRPSDGAKIPITAYYGTAPGVGAKLIEAIRDKGKAACSQDLVPHEAIALTLGESVDSKISAEDISSVVKGSVHSFLQNYQCPEITSLLSDQTCTQLVDAIHAKLSPTFRNLDVDWSPFSDFVVDLGSQQLRGSFNSSTDPFTMKPLEKKRAGDPGTPHITLPFIGEGGADLLGATTHGKEILYALELNNGKTEAQIDAYFNPPAPTPVPIQPQPMIHWNHFVKIPRGTAPDGSNVPPLYIARIKWPNKRLDVETWTFGGALQKCNDMSLYYNLQPVYELANPVHDNDGALVNYRSIKYFPDRNGFRLPTPSEWSYAYLAGTDPGEQYFWGDNTNSAVADKYAVYNDKNNDINALNIQTKLPNNWGLYDIAGLRREWTFTPNTNIQCAMGGNYDSKISDIKYNSKYCIDVSEHHYYYIKHNAVRFVKIWRPQTAALMLLLD